MAQFSIHFYLRPPKSNPNHKKTVWADINYGERLRISIKIKVLEKDWNPNKEEIRASVPSAPIDNKELSDFKRFVEDVIRKYFRQRKKLYPSSLKREIMDVFFKKQTDDIEQFNLLTYIKFYISKNPEKNQHSTMKSYMQLVPLLKQFEESEGEEVLDFNYIDKDWFVNFTDFLFTKRGHRNNNVGKHVKNIKAIMNHSLERGIHTNTSFRHFKKPKAKTTSIALEEEIINKIYDLELSGKEDDVRNLFVFGCQTGLRFSDVTKIIKPNWKGKFLVFRTKKTQDDLVIPLRAKSIAILKKYNGCLPKVYNHEFNKIIKNICSLIPELNEEEIVYITKGENKEEHLVKKYNLVSSHTARRSFATNAYMAGMPTLEIMKFTGHKFEKDFYLYIKLPDNKINEQALKYFNKMDEKGNA